MPNLLITPAGHTMTSPAVESVYFSITLGNSLGSNTVQCDKVTLQLSMTLLNGCKALLQCN